jgi:hypothetical protein
VLLRDCCRGPDGEPVFPGLPDTHQAEVVISVRLTVVVKIIIAFAVMIAIRLRVKAR